MHPPFGSLGFGLGLRTVHYPYILEHKPSLDWFEILTENYLVPGGKPLYFLDAIAECYPLVMHGVSLSIGGTDPLDFDYLRQVKQLSKRVKAHWISDHLCWTGLDQIHLHDLLPLPYTEEAVFHVAQRVHQAQDFLEKPFLLENVSSYISYSHSQITEWEFLNAVAEESNCSILLDINNIYVTAFNHGFDPMDYLKAVSPKRVQQFHLAGHSNHETHIVDTHDHPIVEGVWALYQKALQLFPGVSTMIERDDHIPEMPILLEELNYAKQLTQLASAAK